jgi:hypothetical protein
MSYFNIAPNLPDFLLRELDVLAKVSVVRVKVVSGALVAGRLDPSSPNHKPLDMAKQLALLTKSGLSQSDGIGCISALEFVIDAAVRANLDSDTVALELSQLGLPPEHGEVIAKAVAKGGAELRQALVAKTLTVGAGDPTNVEGSVTMLEHPVRAPIVHLRIDNVNVSMDADQARLLRAELVKAKAAMATR